MQGKVERTIVVSVADMKRKNRVSITMRETKNDSSV
jgi:hypothetical protein